MAVTAKLYGRVFNSLGNKEIGWTADVLKVMLCTSTYVPDQNAHQYKSSVTNEVVGTGYTAGGATLASVTAAYNGATKTQTITCANPSWAASTLTARYAVFYDSTPATDATRPLISYVDFGVDQVSSTGTFTIVIDSAGVATFTVA